ncbi:MAG: SLOG family protein [Clostridia bacterium]
MIIFPFATSDIICSFTGPRPEKIDDDIDDVYFALKIAILDAVNQGYKYFITGMSRGFDLLAAKCILDLQRDYDVFLIAAIPFFNQDERWSEDDKITYREILCRCRYTFCTSEKFHRGAYYERNRFMVDHCSKIITYYNNSLGGTKYTLDYATKFSKKITNIHNCQTTF